MIAVIKAGGKQHLVKEGDVLRIEKITTEPEQTFTFEEVLMLGETDGSHTSIGMPMLSGATVEAKVLKQGRAKKVIVRKFKAKVRYARTYGHRQPFTEIQITKISA